MFKRKMFTVATAVLIAASNLSICSNAVETKNIVSYSVDTVTESFIAPDGSVIAAGSTAISVNIEANEGMIASEYQITVVGTDVITNKYGYVVIESCGQSEFAAAQNDNTIFVAGVSAEADTHNGTLFTVYCKSMPAQVTLSEIDLYKNQAVLSAATKMNLSNYQPRVTDRILIGDMNADDMVDASDAQRIAHSIGIAKENGWNQFDYPIVLRSDYSAHLSDLLPGVTLYNPSTHIWVTARSADGNNDLFVIYDPNNSLYSDASQLLQYYVCSLSMVPYTTPGYEWGTYYDL